MNFHPDRPDVSTPVNFDVLRKTLDSLKTNNFGADAEQQTRDHDPIYLREKLKRHVDHTRQGLKALMPSISELRKIEGRDAGSACRRCRSRSCR